MRQQSGSKACQDFTNALTYDCAGNQASGGGSKVRRTKRYAKGLSVERDINCPSNGAELMTEASWTTRRDQEALVTGIGTSARARTWGDSTYPTLPHRNAFHSPFLSLLSLLLQMNAVRFLEWTFRNTSHARHRLNCKPLSPRKPAHSTL